MCSHQGQQLPRQVELFGIPPASRGVPQVVQFTFDIYANGIFFERLCHGQDHLEPESPTASLLLINDKGQLSKEEIKRMLKYKCILTTLKFT